MHFVFFFRSKLAYHLAFAEW